MNGKNKIPTMECFINAVYEQEVCDFVNLLNQYNNVLAISTDHFILTSVVDKTKEHFINKNWSIEEVISKKNIKDKTLIIFEYDKVCNSSRQSILYYYLELCMSRDCKFIIYTQNLTVTESMEKRVKSRFSNQTICLRPLSFIEYVSLYLCLLFCDKKTTLQNTCKKFCKRKTFYGTKKKVITKKVSKKPDCLFTNKIDEVSTKTESTDDRFSPTLVNILSKNEICLIVKETEKAIKNNQYPIKSNGCFITEKDTDRLQKQYYICNDTVNLLNLYTKQKYKIADCALDSFLKVLDNIHLVILLMFCNDKITFNNVVHKFKQFVTNCKEMKNCTDSEIFSAFCDLDKFQLISPKGLLSINETCIRKFINLPENANFLKSLLCKVS